MDEAGPNNQLPNSENVDENIASFVFTEQFGNVNVDAPHSDISFTVTDSVCSESDSQCLQHDDSCHPPKGIRHPLDDHLQTGSSLPLSDNSHPLDGSIYPLGDHLQPGNSHPLGNNFNPLESSNHPLDDHHSHPSDGSTHPLGDSSHQLGDQVQSSDSHPLGDNHSHSQDGSTHPLGDSSHQLGDQLQSSNSHPLGDHSHPPDVITNPLGDHLQPGSGHPLDDHSHPPSGISHQLGDHMQLGTSHPLGDHHSHPPDGSTHPLGDHLQASCPLGDISNSLGDIDNSHPIGDLSPVSHPPSGIGHPPGDHMQTGSSHPLGDQLQPCSSHPIDDNLNPLGGTSHPPDNLIPPPDVSTHPSGVGNHCCDQCGRGFHHLVEYLGHRITHAGSKVSTTCELCGTGYSRQTTLRDHYRKKHQVDFTVKQRKTSVSPTSMTLSDRQSKSSEANGKCFKRKKDEAKTVHVVITKTDVEDKFADIDGCSSLDMDRSQLLSYGKQDVGEDDLYKEIDTSMSGILNMDGPGDAGIEPDPECTPDTSNPGHQTSLTISAEDDFHFVLLKNIIPGNSFKYGKDRFKCLHCDFKSYWRGSICAHMKQLHSDMMSIHQFIEIKPPESDTRPGQTIIKMSDYMSSLQVRKSSVRRIRGVEKQDLPGNFVCSKCNKEFSRLRYLRKHMLVHKADKKYLCDECGKAFKARSYLKTHYRTHKTKEFRCNQCSFCSTVNTAIHAHRQLHNDNSVICDVCGFAYADNSTLKKHKLVHDPTRPFPCTFPGCTWRFKSEVMCLAHYNAHTTEGKFRCSVCGYVFRHKHHLHRHQSKMHGIANTGTVTIGEVDAKMAAERLAADVDLHSTVNLIVESQLERDQLESALQSGQLIIATDDDGNAINYEVADITMSVTYHTLSEDDPA